MAEASESPYKAGKESGDGLQSLEERELRSDAEGRYRQVELVEEAEGSVDGVDDLAEALLLIINGA